ncbi:hypothetical protein EJ08DRAFT_664528 [Tothia fuscella]|uniref:Uncharacterized protein n=1 Tax=Tothia fuscella TaxID=1048955 RepID=A0A9P4TV05_9PEZI|nr:hypothetical protein EJ08DRAFT_664528 [Tothia fuscella]
MNRGGSSMKEEEEVNDLVPPPNHDSRVRHKASPSRDGRVEKKVKRRRKAALTKERSCAKLHNYSLTEQTSNLLVPDISADPNVAIEPESAPRTRTPSIVSFQSEEIGGLPPLTPAHRERLQDPIVDIQHRVVFAYPEDGQVEARLDISWGLPSYCRDSLDGRKDSTSLDDVLCLSGTIEAAYATTCGDYMRRFWPEAKWYLLEILGLALMSDSSEGPICFVSINPEYTIEFNYIAGSAGADTPISVTFSGSRTDFITLAQQIAWLTACFREPRPDELDYSDIAFFQTTPSSLSLQSLDLRPIELEEQLCWYPMFVNTIVAFGFPVPDRDHQKGVGLPMEVMRTLGRIWYPKEYLDGFVFKGYSTALIPVSRNDNSLQWHYICQKSKLSMSAILEKHSDRLTGLTPDEMDDGKLRMFLGLYERAVIHLGTEGSGYEKIQSSRALLEGNRAAAAREVSAAATAGKYAGGTVTSKFLFPRGLRSNIESDDLQVDELLLQSPTQALLLFDTATERGWLAPEASALLHLLHCGASQMSRKYERPIPHAPLSSHGGKAAYDTLLEENIELRKKSGNDKALYLYDVVRQMYKALYGTKEQVIERKGVAFKPLRVSHYLYGWDFIDVARKNIGLPSRREVKIEESEALKVILANEGIAVLVGERFGDPIRPQTGQTVCDSWTPIPYNRFYMVASVPCIQALTDSLHGKGNHAILAQKHYCQRAPGGQLFEQCDWTSHRGCNRVQFISKNTPKDSYPLLTAGETGAVLFGVNRLGKPRRCVPYEGNLYTPLTSEAPESQSSSASGAAPSEPHATDGAE